MPKRLSLAEQRRLIKILPPHRVNACKAHCRAKQMKGEGIKDILKSISSVLGPVAKELGPVVMKEFLLPFLKKKMEGGALSLAGGAKKPKKKRRGAGLRLAGQR